MNFLVKFSYSQIIASEPNNEQQNQFCFVVGPYKTATSLATLMLEQLGYENPSHMDNANDFAVGISKTRYLTRESKVVRDMNIRLLDNIGCGIKGFSFPTNATPSKSIMLDILSFLELTSGSKVVLKDPLFCWTLRYWIQACDVIGVPRKVIFTHRKNDLLKAWKNAPFTKMLLRDSEDVLERMVKTTYLQYVSYYKNCLDHNSFQHNNVSIFQAK